MGYHGKYVEEFNNEITHMVMISNIKYANIKHTNCIFYDGIYIETTIITNYKLLQIITIITSYK